MVAHGDAPNLRSPQGGTIAPAPNQATAFQRARDRFDTPGSNTNAPAGYKGETQARATFQTRADAAAPAYCTDAGYERVSADGVTISGPLWEYTHSVNSFNAHLARATKIRTWTATCEKEVRRRR